MRSKAIAKLGFGYDDVAAINPAIVYTNCYGYGRRGPNRDRPAYDDTIQAECGLPAVQEQLTGEANYVGTIMADKVAGLTALYATMMALFHRERTGEGQEVEVSMFETMASFMLVEHANGAMFDPPLGPAVYPRTVAPNRQAVPHQGRPHRRADLQRQALERLRRRGPAGVGDRAVRHSRTAARTTSTPCTGWWPKRMRERTTDEWLALFRELEIPAAAINTPDALFDNPHLNAVGLFETVETPYGPVRMPGVPTWFSRTPGRIAGPDPRTGRRHRGRARRARTDRADVEPAVGSG